MSYKDYVKWKSWRNRSKDEEIAEKRKATKDVVLDTKPIKVIKQDGSSKTLPPRTI